jgi:hypothetical protein
LLTDFGGAGDGGLIACTMNLVDRIAYEGNGHAKRQHYGYHKANAQSQPELDIPQYQSSSCQPIATDRAITLFYLVFRHMTGDDGCDSRNEGYKKP